MIVVTSIMIIVVIVFLTLVCLIMFPSWSSLWEWGCVHDLCHWFAIGCHQRIAAPLSWPAWKPNFRGTLPLLVKVAWPELQRRAVLWARDGVPPSAARAPRFSISPPWTKPAKKGRTSPRNWQDINTSFGTHGNLGNNKKRIVGQICLFSPESKFVGIGYWLLNYSELPPPTKSETIVDGLHCCHQGTKKLSLEQWKNSCLWKSALKKKRFCHHHIHQSSTLWLVMYKPSIYIYIIYVSIHFFMRGFYIECFIFPISTSLMRSYLNLAMRLLKGCWFLPSSESRFQCTT